MSPSGDPHRVADAEEGPNPATVAALLDIAWRTVDAESARREGINGKASSLASFAAVVLSLTATLGREFLSLEDRWQLVLYCISLLALVAALAVAVWVLLPQKRQVFGAAYLADLPSREKVRQSPEFVQGQAMRGLIMGLESDRELNARNAQRVFLGFVLLAVGLVAVALEAMIAAVAGVK